MGGGSGGDYFRERIISAIAPSIGRHSLASERSGTDSSFVHSENKSEYALTEVEFLNGSIKSLIV